jgi:EAL domain-containing protein (putative c-di-GMP-specific phosphodiesterase class I)
MQIELTESVMLNGTSRAAETMNRLHTLGVSLAIDDFGTGYSCLGYLPKLPFDALKIDRSFVNEIGSRPEIRAMVHSLVTLAHNLGMRVIVEGIETLTQLNLVTELGSNEVQGFLLGRPTADPASQLHLREQLSEFPNAQLPANFRMAEKVRKPRRPSGLFLHFHLTTCLGIQPVRPILTSDRESNREGNNPH